MILLVNSLKKRPLPKPLPEPLPSPLLQGEGSGINFFIWRGFPSSPFPPLRGSKLRREGGWGVRFFDCANSIINFRVKAKVRIELTGEAFEPVSTGLSF